jgi:hypothetical protein
MVEQSRFLRLTSHSFLSFCKIVARLLSVGTKLKLTASGLAVPRFQETVSENTLEIERDVIRKVYPIPPGSRGLEMEPNSPGPVASKRHTGGRAPAHLPKLQVAADNSVIERPIHSTCRYLGRAALGLMTAAAAGMLSTS